MKKRLITTTIIAVLLVGVTFALNRNTIDIENAGKYRLWKYNDEYVGVQRTITDANGKDIMNSVEAVAFKVKYQAILELLE